MLGLAEGGVDWALDENNRDLISPSMEEVLGAAKKRIISGELKVADYTQSNACDY